MTEKSGIAAEPGHPGTPMDAAQDRRDAASSSAAASTEGVARSSQGCACSETSRRGPEKTGRAGTRA